MDYTNQIRHLRFLAEDARHSSERRAKLVNKLLDENYDLFNLLDYLNVSRTNSATKYHSAVAADSPGAYDMLKLLQTYDNDHRMLTSALRDLAFLLIKYKSEMQDVYCPPEADE